MNTPALTLFSSFSGKHLLALLLATGMSAFALLSISYGPEQVWTSFGVQSMTPAFADLRTITGGAESVALGLDPMSENPGDPWNRPLNYPRIWQALYALGVNASHTVPIALSIIGLFVIAMFLFTGPFDRRTGFLLAVAIFSPAVLFGVERANTDLLMFFFLALGLRFLTRSPWAYLALVLASFVLKIYPLMALAALLFLDRKHASRMASVAALVIVVYLVVSWSDLRLILANTPRSTDTSYGMEVLWRSLPDRNESLRLVLQWISYPLALAVLLYSLLQRKLAVPENSDDVRHMNAFRAGAAVFIGTFLFGSNWDYRLVFVLLMIPQLILWSSAVSVSTKRLALLSLTAIFLMLWNTLLFGWLEQLPYGFYLRLVVDEGAGWLAFATVSILFMSSPILRARIALHSAYANEGNS